MQINKLYSKPQTMELPRISYENESESSIFFHIHLQLSLLSVARVKPL